MTDAPELPEELDALIEDFVARERRGEQPTISEYVRRHPEFAKEIPQVFPLLVVMEGVKAPSGSPAPPRSIVGVDASVRRLGHYRILREVGRGGMGVVYEALQETLDRRVALKVLPPHAMLDAQFVARFRVEAQAAARLTHPNIVPVIGLGEDRGIHYYTMQFIEGDSLDVLLERTRAFLVGDPVPTDGGLSSPLFGPELPDRVSGSSVTGGSEPSATRRTPDAPERSARADRRTYFRNVAHVGLQAADGLAYAHAQGVLHRDVKPSNLILDDSGRVWIADFGLCRDEASDGLTQAGDLVGTLRYLAPECFRGAHDVRSDIYGLGLTLRELLTVRPARDGPTRAALVRQIAEESLPRIRSRTPDVPIDLATIVEKATAAEPVHRYATAEALVGDLTSFLEGRPISARAPSLRYLVAGFVRRHKALAATLLGALLAVVVLTVLYVRDVKKQETQARTRHYAASVAAAETALRDGDLPRAGILLRQAPPEFRHWEWRHLESRLHPELRRFASLSPHRAFELAYSPDGRWVAVGTRSKVRVFDEQSGEPVQDLEVDCPALCLLAWDAEGGRLATAGHDRLLVWAWPEGRAIHDERWPDDIRALAFDPASGDLLVGGDDGRVVRLDGQGFAVLDEVSLPTRILGLDVHPAGERIAVARLDGRVTLLDDRPLRSRWTRTVSPRLVESVAYVGSDLVAACAFDGALHLLQARDGSLARILPHGGRIWDVAASPDGRLLASVEVGGRLHLFNVESGRRQMPRAHGRETSRVAFHPDGSRVMTGSWSGTLVEWDCATEDDPLLLRPHVDDTLSVALHPDGRRAVTGGVCGVVRLWDLATGELLRTWPGQHGFVYALDIDPAGRVVASGDRSSTGTLVLRRLSDGAVVHRLAAHDHGVCDLAFDDDGGRLFTVGRDGSVATWDARTGELVRRVRVSEAPLYAVALGPRGRGLAVAGQDGAISILERLDLTIRRRVRGHSDVVRDLAFDPEGEVLLSVGHDQTVRIWDAKTYGLLDVLTERNPALGEHTDALQCVVFHPGGDRLLVGARQAAIRIWDWRRGVLLSTLQASPSWVQDLAFSADGSRLVSAHTRGYARIWDTRPARQLAPLREASHRLRERAQPHFQRHRAGTEDPRTLLSALQQDPTIETDVREAALRLAHTWLGSRAGLKAWVWSALLDPEADADDLRAARAIAGGFVRASAIRGLQDGEGYLLAGLTEVRIGGPHGGNALEHSLQLNHDQSDLRAIALAELVRHAAEAGDMEEARSRLAELERLIHANPAMLQGRVLPFVHAARGALR